MPRPFDSRRPGRGPARPGRGAKAKSTGPAKPQSRGSHSGKLSRKAAAADAPPRRGAHPARIAERLAALAPELLNAVFRKGKRAASVLDGHPDPRRGFDPADRRLMGRSLSALFRWQGWIDQLGTESIKERLLVAWLLDSDRVHPICRIWALDVGRNPDELIVAGDAPNWTMRAEALKRWAGERTVNADPWRLFPDWLRDQLPTPPGDASAKMRKLEFLHAIQTRPALWAVAPPDSAKAVWDELRRNDLKPWVHRRIANAAKLPSDSDLHVLDSFREGRFWIEDLSSVALGIVCDPDPGERWWDACAGSGLRALSLAARMGGRGFVAATVEWEHQRREIVKRMRQTPLHNVSPKIWDGRKLPGKPGSFDGVLVDAPSSAIGSWRRLPDARWIAGAAQVDQFAEQQLRLLDLAAQGVTAGGSLVYSVATVTQRETAGVVRSFLESHPEFRPTPFPHPLDDGTTDGTLQLWPQLHDCDARFIARFTRTGPVGSSHVKPTEVSDQDREASGQTPSNTSEAGPVM